MLCDTEITDDTRSKEHLIINAIGGWRKVSDVLCRSCNSASGDGWDAELAKQLLPLCHLLGIQRDRGAVPDLDVITTEAERLTIAADRGLRLTDPVFKATPAANGGIAYRISARTIQEARRIIEGLGRKHPQIDVEETLRQVQVVETYPAGAVHHELGLGGEIAGRSIVKSCVIMAFEAGIHWRHCGHALAYLRNSSASPCFGFYQARDLVVDRPTGVPLHCLAVSADPTSGMILAYAEYFGIHRVVACLGDGYNGPPVSSTYAIDPRNGTTLDLAVDLRFGAEEIAEIYDYKYFSGDVMKRSVADILGPVIERRLNDEQARLLNAAVDEAFASCGAREGEVLTEEHLHWISNSVAARVTPFLLRRLTPIRPRSLGSRFP